MTKPKAREPGPTLCSGHARSIQATGELQGECEPEIAWTGGFGQTVTCDVVNNPDRAADYAAFVAAAITRRARRLSSGTTT